MYKFRFLANCTQYSKRYKIKENCKFLMILTNIFHFKILKDTQCIINRKSHWILRLRYTPLRMTKRSNIINNTITPTYYKNVSQKFPHRNKMRYIKINLSTRKFIMANKYAGTQTEKNLEAAFAGESQARNKYTYFASRAKKDGFEQIAALFQKTADNEKEHS